MTILLCTIATIFWNGTGVVDSLLFIYHDELLATAGVTPFINSSGPGRLVCFGGGFVPSWGYVSGSEVSEKDLDSFIQTLNLTDDSSSSISRLTRNSNHPIVTPSNNSLNGLWTCNYPSIYSDREIEYVGLYSRIEGEWLIYVLYMWSTQH